MNDKLWIRRYRLAVRFASFFDRVHRYDIVHNAWIYYLDKTHEDPFEIELRNESSFLYTVIKKSFFRWRYHERKGNDNRVIDLNGMYDKHPTEETEWEQWEGSALTGGHSPEEELIALDLYNLFYQKLFLATKPTDNRHYRTDKSRQLPLDIFKLKAAGHDQRSIAKELNISPQLVNHYVKKIEELAWLNPFNGNRLVVKKVITSVQWQNRKDKEDFEMDDENEFYVLYQHKESKEGLLVRLKK